MFSIILDKYKGTNNDLDGTDKNTTHSYTEVYDALFEMYRLKAKSVLEIGIRTGAALNAYSDYFMNANIYGIDIEDNVMPQYKKIPRTHIYIGNAMLNKTITYFNTKYDIIIEDASHKLEDQIQHFKDFSSLINPGGVYIIEDVPESAMIQLKNETEAYGNLQGFTLIIHDLRNKKNRFDDILFIFRRAL